MTVIVITPPAALLSVPDAKAMAPALGGYEDTQVEALLYTAQASIEPLNSWVGRSMGVQTLELVLDRFGCEPIPLLWAPLISVTSVKYLDVSGVEQTVDSGVYEVHNQNTMSPRLYPKSGNSWPSTYSAVNTVRIRYQAGHAASDPTLYIVKQALVLKASRLATMAATDLSLRSESVEGVGSRAWSGTTISMDALEAAADALLTPLRIWA